MTDDRYSRQSFLGPEEVFANATVGVIGLGGGGSHIVQQLSHVGFKRLVLYDADVVESSNLNRLVGATVEDSLHRTPKVRVAERMIRGLIPDARVVVHQKRWQDAPEDLRRCDLVFGCVDGFSERDQLEASCRRSLIPYLDIGIDVHVVGDEPPLMGGQVILSMPGGPCMKCMGFITDRNLEKEAARYGDAGPRPQVVWANGLVASAAVGIGVDVLTGWTKSLRDPMYLEYRGNAPLLHPHARVVHQLFAECPHYPAAAVGEHHFANV